MKCFVLYVTLIFFTTIMCFDEISSGVFGNLKKGIQMAGQFLGLDRSSGIAQLVSQTFGGKATRKQDYDQYGNHVFSGFLRLLGLDSKKLGAIAINAIIFLAQLISSSLIAPPSELTHARNVKNGTPFDWIMNTTQVSDMLDLAKDEELSENIVEYIKDTHLDEDSDCVQLLVCKSTPFIVGMQKALKAKGADVIKGPKVFSQFFPSVDEFATHGDTCEDKHKHCLLNY